MKLPAGQRVQRASPVCVVWLPGAHGVWKRPSQAEPTGQMRQQSSAEHVALTMGLKK